MTSRTVRTARERRPVRPALPGLVALSAVALLGCAATDGETLPQAPGAVPTASAPPASAPTALPAEPSRAPVADPVRVSAPDAGIDTTLVPVGLDEDAAMELPEPGSGAWYELGPRPGEPGPAVLVGHVDSVHGPDVFYRLSSLEDGDVVVVEDARGDRHEFTVEVVEVVEKDALPYERIWAETAEPLLRLITCGGDYDRAAGGYQHNVVVYAALAARSGRAEYPTDS